MKNTPMNTTALPNVQNNVIFLMDYPNLSTHFLTPRIVVMMLFVQRKNVICSCKVLWHVAMIVCLFLSFCKLTYFVIIFSREGDPTQMSF